MTREEIISSGLLSDVENYLDVTWSDEATDRKYLGFIASGMAYLDKKAGEELDYSADGDGRTLLMEYVRYARDGAMDVFENNYLHLLLAMQNDRRLTAYGTAKTAVPTGE